MNIFCVFQETCKNFSIDLPLHVVHLEEYQKRVFSLLAKNTKKKNSTEPITMQDIFIIANRLENDDGDSVGITRMEVHIGYALGKCAILNVFDQIGIPCNTDSYFMTSDNSKVSQTGRKRLTYSRGSTITIGNQPVGDATTMTAYAEALCMQAKSWEDRAAKRLDIINNERRENEKKNTKIADLELKINELEENLPQVGDKRPRTEKDQHDESEIIKTLVSQVTQLMGDIREANKKVEEERKLADKRVQDATHGARNDLLAERKKNSELQKKWNATVSRLRRATRRIRQFADAPEEHLLDAQAQARRVLDEIGRLSFAADWDNDMEEDNVQ
jgi:hypothetical protein